MNLKSFKKFRNEQKAFKSFLIALKKSVRIQKYLKKALKLILKKLNQTKNNWIMSEAF